MRAVFRAGVGSTGDLEFMTWQREHTFCSLSSEIKEMILAGPIFASEFNGGEPFALEFQSYVCRQSFWDKERLKLGESLARLVCNVMDLRTA
jgi:hypothetical protein